MILGNDWVTTNNLEEAFEIYKHLQDIKETCAYWVECTIISPLIHGDEPHRVFIDPSSVVSLRHYFAEGTKVEKGIL